MADDITPKILLEHMQNMQGVLTKAIRDVREEIRDVRTDLGGRIDRLEKKVDQNHAILSMQISNLDERLDDLEIVQVPTIKKAVGIK